MTSTHHAGPLPVKPMVPGGILVCLAATNDVNSSRRPSACRADGAGRLRMPASFPLAHGNFRKRKRQAPSHARSQRPPGTALQCSGKAGSPAQPQCGAEMPPSPVVPPPRRPTRACLPTTVVLHLPAPIKALATDLRLASSNQSPHCTSKGPIIYSPASSHGIALFPAFVLTLSVRLAGKCQTTILPRKSPRYVARSRLP
jgi:hypothetical protein